MSVLTIRPIYVERPPRPCSVHKNLGPRLDLFNSLRHFTRLSPNFYRRLRSPKFGLNFDPSPLWVASVEKRSNIIWNLKQTRDRRWLPKFGVTNKMGLRSLWKMGWKICWMTSKWAVYYPTVLKVDTLICWCIIGLEIKPRTTGEASGGLQVAIHRTCHLF